MRSSTGSRSSTFPPRDHAPKSAGSSEVTPSPAPSEKNSPDEARESIVTHSKSAKARKPTGRKPPRVKPVESKCSTLDEAAAKFDALISEPPQSTPKISPSNSRPLLDAAPEKGGAAEEERVAAEAAPAEEPAPRDAGFRQPGDLGACPAIVCFAALTLLVFATLGAVKLTLPLWHPEDDDLDSAFCCPEEVKALASFVDTTVDPCSSFFDFVCSKIVEQRVDAGEAASSFVPPLSLNVSFEHGALITSRVTRSRVSTFLRSLFASCMSAALDENTAFLELADLLVAVGATSYLRDMNLTSAFAYLFVTNLKYRISSVVSVSWKRAGAITIAHRPRELSDVLGSTFQRSIVASTTTMKKIANRETRAEDVTAVFSELLIADTKTIVTRRHTGANATELLRRWHMREALKMASIDIGDVTTIDVNGSRHVDAFVRIVSSLNETTSDRTSAYILACSLHDAFVDLRWPSGQSEKEMLPFCLRRLDSMPNLRNLMYFDEFATDQRVRQVTQVINDLLVTIENDCVRSLALNREDVPRLKAFFDRISLAHPLVLNRPYIREFNSSHSFLHRLLEGRAYELQENLNLAQAGLPFDEPGPGVDYHYLYVHNAEKVVVSPTLYALVRTDPAHTVIFNTPVIGVAFAEAIWKFVLKQNTFLSDTARDSIENLVECFRRNYLTVYEDELNCVDDRTECVDDLDTVAAGLALSSVVRTLTEGRWHKVEAAWPPWSLSHGQFFYLRETFYRCPTSSAPKQIRDHVDVPLMYVGDFSAAFQCRSTDRMARTQACTVGLEGGT